MAAVPHLKDGYSSGFVATTKGLLSQKADVVRALRPRSLLLFLSCLFYYYILFLPEKVKERERRISIRRPKFHMWCKGIYILILCLLVTFFSLFFLISSYCDLHIHVCAHLHAKFFSTNLWRHLFGRIKLINSFCDCVISK